MCDVCVCGVCVCGVSMWCVVSVVAFLAVWKRDVAGRNGRRMLIWRLPTPWARTGRTPPYLVVSLRLCARADVDLLQDLVAACRRAPCAALFELCRLACAAAAGADVRVRVGVAKREGAKGRGAPCLGG